MARLRDCFSIQGTVIIYSIESLATTLCSHEA
jgi:hypothetical protein